MSHASHDLFYQRFFVLSSPFTPLSKPWVAEKLRPMRPPVRVGGTVSDSACARGASVSHDQGPAQATQHHSEKSQQSRMAEAATTA